MCQSVTVANAHEIVHKKIVIFHPYLMVDEKLRSHAFMSIENLSDKSEYLIGIKPNFCETFQIFRIDQNGISSEINLGKGLEIPLGEIIYIELETIGRIFSGLKDISWFNPHLATFVFKNAEKVELDFELEA